MSNKRTDSDIARYFRLNLSRRSMLSLLSFILIHGLIVYQTIRIHQYYTNQGYIKNIHLYSLILSGVLLFIAILFFQEFFISEPDQIIIERLSRHKAGNKIRRFYNRSGFKSPQYYTLPFFCHLFFLVVTMSYFVIPVFHISGSNTIIIKMMGWIPVLFFGFVLFFRYSVMASYLEINKDVFIVRKGLITWYFTAGSVDQIIYLTRDGSLNTIMFKFERKGAILFKLNFLSRYAESIKKEIDSLYEGDTKTSVLKRIPKQEKRTIARQLSGGFGHITRW